MPDKTIEDYRSYAEGWVKTVKPFTAVSLVYPTIWCFQFISTAYETLFLPQLKKEICVFGTHIIGNGRRVYKVFLGTSTPYSCTSISGNKIKAWFAKHYPGVAPCLSIATLSDNVPGINPNRD